MLEENTTKNMEQKSEVKIVHCKRDHFDVYIGRGSKWGNPFTHVKSKQTLARFVVKDRETAIAEYLKYITTGEGLHLLRDLHELKGKTLGCYCSPLPCHGTVLKKLVEKFYK